MRTNTLLLSLSTAFVLLVGLVGCTTAPKETVSMAEPTGQFDLAKIRTEIQALETDFGKAATNHDLDALLEYYADDAISLANDAPMLVGKKAIGEHYTKNLMGDKKTHTYQTIDVFAEGTLVVETGKSTVTNSNGTIRTGKYMALYEKRNGQYVCLREMYNNDEPSQ
ncbi:YybH family protein [Salmonirosea aquatica]